MRTRIRNKEKKKLFIDWPIFLPGLILSVVGCLTLLSTAILPEGGLGDITIVEKQILFLVIGLILYFLISNIDLSYLKYWQIALVIYVVTILLLLAVLLFAPYINGVKRWLVFGGTQIQPSEIAKITTILVTATIFSYKKKYNEILLLIVSLIFVLPMFFLIYIEPHGSMSILILALWFLVAFTGLSNQLRNTAIVLIIALISGGLILRSITENNLWLLISLSGFVISVFAFYFRHTWKIFVLASLGIGILIGIFGTFTWHNFLKEYQKDRITAYFNPEENTEDIAFNVNQARIAIGSGQLIGKGFGNGTQSKREFLPEHRTDFIFASFAEEFGLVGCIFLISLYLIILINGLMTSMNNQGDTFLAMIAMGVAMKILLEVFINIGTNTGAIPATGIPLPLVSAGGTITMMTWASLALLSSTKRKFNV